MCSTIVVVRLSDGVSIRLIMRYTGVIPPAGDGCCIMDQNLLNSGQLPLHPL